MTEQIINKRLGSKETLNNWDKFWEIYFDEVDHNNYQEVSLKNLILMNSTPNTIDFTDCFEKMLFTVMKFINIDRNPFKNNEIIDNDFINNGFINYIVSNFDTKIILTTDNAVEDYLNDLVFNDANLAIDIQKISLKLPSELIPIISDSYIDDTYKLRQYIEDLLQLNNPINRTPEIINFLEVFISRNKNPHSFDIIKKFIKEGVISFNQPLLENLASNENDEAVDLIINNLQTPQNPNGIILNTENLQINLARNTNIRALNFYAENYRQGNFTNVFDNRSIYSDSILRILLENENSFPILDDLGIIDYITTNQSRRLLTTYIRYLAQNTSDLAVNIVIPYISGTNFPRIPYGNNILSQLASNNNPIAFRTSIVYLREYTTIIINSGRTADPEFGLIIGELAINSNDEAVDYVFEVLNNGALNYMPTRRFWRNYILNTNDRAVNYILQNINTIYALPNPNQLMRWGLRNKNPIMRQYLMDNYLNIHHDIGDFEFLFENEDIFEIDDEDRRNKIQQIKTFIDNVYTSLYKTNMNRDTSIYGLE
jgi:hypothetical protein